MAADFDRITRAWVQDRCYTESIDFWFGRNLPTLLTDLGLVDGGCEALEFRRTGGGPEAELFAQSFQLVRDGVMPGGFPPDVDVDRVIDALRDPGFAFVDSRNVGAWGRRPRIGYLG
jgi:hypothetical protein